MKTIVMAGSPFNVSESVADSIREAERDRDSSRALMKAQMAAEQAGMAATAALRSTTSPKARVLPPMGSYMDSMELPVDVCFGLHQDGVVDIIDAEDGLHFVAPSTAIAMANEGLLIRSDAPKQRKGKQCPGGYWIPKGRNCRKSGAASAGAKSLDRISKGGKTTKKRAARQKRIAELRAKRNLLSMQGRTGKKARQKQTTAIGKSIGRKAKTPKGENPEISKKLTELKGSMARSNQASGKLKKLKKELEATIAKNSPKAAKKTTAKRSRTTSTGKKLTAVDGGGKGKAKSKQQREISKAAAQLMGTMAKKSAQLKELEGMAKKGKQRRAKSTASKRKARQKRIKELQGRMAERAASTAKRGMDPDFEAIKKLNRSEQMSGKMNAGEKERLKVAQQKSIARNSRKKRAK